jgi:hypothetical protein
LSEGQFDRKLSMATGSMNLGKDGFKNGFKNAVYEGLYGHLNFEKGVYTTDLADYSYPIIQDAIKTGLKDYIYSNLNYGVNVSNKNCQSIDSKGYMFSVSNGKKATQVKVGVNNILTPKDYERIFNKVHLEMFGYKNTSKKPQHLVCTISYKEYAKKHDKIYKKIKENNPIYSKSLNNISTRKLTPEFVNSSKLHRRIAMNVMHNVFYKYSDKVGNGKNKTLSSYFRGRLEGKYDEFYKSVDFRTIETFRKSIRNFLLKAQRDVFYEKAKSQGIDIGFLRYKKVIQNEIEFYNTPQIKKQIKSKFPHLINVSNEVIVYRKHYKTETGKVLYNKAAFTKNLAQREIDNYVELLNDNKLMFEGQKYEQLGDNIAKGFVAIPLVLFISTFMIILSLINLLIKILSLFNISSKVLTPLKIGLFFGILILPMIIPNKYSSNQLVANNSNKIVKVSTKWLLNTEVLMSMIAVDNSFVRSLYNKSKYASYSFAKRYNVYNNKSTKSLELKSRHDKEKFNFD